MTQTTKQRVHAISTEISVYAHTLSHWGNGRDPTSQQLQDLASELSTTWEAVKLLETLLAKGENTQPKPHDSIAVACGFCEHEYQFEARGPFAGVQAPCPNCKAGHKWSLNDYPEETA